MLFLLLDVSGIYELTVIFRELIPRMKVIFRSTLSPFPQTYVT